MSRLALPIVTLGLSLASLPWGWAAGPNPEQAQAMAEIRKLGGKVTVDEKSPDKPAVSVDLAGTKVTDAGLEHLKGLGQLQELRLAATDVTDKGVKKLQQALPKCQILWQGSQ